MQIYCRSSEQVWLHGSLLEVIRGSQSGESICCYEREIEKIAGDLSVSGLLQRWPQISLFLAFPSQFTAEWACMVHSRMTYAKATPSFRVSSSRLSAEECCEPRENKASWRSNKWTPSFWLFSFWAVTGKLWSCAGFLSWEVIICWLQS